MSSFLDKDYEIPEKPGKYMKLKDGENRFRILSKTPLLGYLDWTKDKKPIRFPMDAPPETSIDPSRPVKHFWAMIVWNYNVGMIQILEVTQTSIQKKLMGLATDIDWGDPREYDIKITRSGSGMDTEYDVKPGRTVPIATEIMQHARATKVDIDELLTGGDPFGAETTLAHTWWRELERMPTTPLPAVAIEAPEVLDSIERSDGIESPGDPLPF